MENRRVKKKMQSSAKLFLITFVLSVIVFSPVYAGVNYDGTLDAVLFPLKGTDAHYAQHKPQRWPLLRCHGPGKSEEEFICELGTTPGAIAESYMTNYFANISLPGSITPGSGTARLYDPSSCEIRFQVDMIGFRLPTFSITAPLGVFHTVPNAPEFTLEACAAILGCDSLAPK